MRIHIELDDELVRRLDDVAGPNSRSEFVPSAIEDALDRRPYRQAFTAAAGRLSEPHDWDDDPAAWVRDQRGRNVRHGLMLARSIGLSDVIVESWPVGQ